jgi:hypothetical protein
MAMSQPTSNRGRFVSPNQLDTLSVHFPDASFPAGAPSKETDCPVMKFPASGRVVGARVIPNVAIGSGTVNYSVGLINAGQALPPAGTIQPFASLTAGTLTANWPIELTIDTTNDKDLFAAGDWISAKVILNGDPSVDFTVQLDYSLDPN